MATEPIVEEDYASSEDSDFAPEDGPAPESSSESEAEADATAPARTATKRKRQPEDGAAEDAGFENSGDEAIIEKGKKKSKKRKKDQVEDGPNEDEDAGEGGLIKTRSQRAQEKAERKAAVANGPVTVDVDALWAQMTSGAAAPAPAAESEKQHGIDDGTVKDAIPGSDTRGESGKTGQDGAEMIKIKRTYNFAGRVHTEEKLVPRDSAEAKLHLESLGENADPGAAEDDAPKRMPRKAFRSIFEPMMEQISQRSDLNLGMSVRLRARELARQDAKKLNTVEKSRMDWAGFVDKEGIKDELALAGKSKGSFAERQQFLARSEAKREEEARRLRLSGKA